MSTQKTNTQGKRISKLLTMGEKLFHLKDLATIWNITNYNTLRTTIKRYRESGLLHPIYKGFYSVIPKEKLDPYLLGAKAIHGYCYISSQTVFFIEGYNSQKPQYITFVGEKSKKFVIGENYYMSRQLKSEFLFNPEGIEIKNGVYWATIPRAIADMLHFNPKHHFDRSVDWKEVRSMQKKIGYPRTPQRYDHSTRN